MKFPPSDCRNPHSSKHWNGQILAACVFAIAVSTVEAQPTPASSSDPRAAELFRSAAALQNRELYDLAADEWSVLLNEHAADPLASKARHYRGVCLFQLQRYEQAIADFEQVVRATPEFELLEETLVNLGLAQFNQAQVAEANDQDSVSKRRREAVATLGQQLKRFPNGPLAPQAHYYRAEALYALGERAKAVTSYQPFTDRYADHPLRPQALYGLGVAQQESNQHAAAGRTFEEFLRSYEGNELAPEVTLRWGETLLADGLPAQAEVRFAQAAAINNFPEADYAMERQAVCRFELKNYRAATELYTTLVKRFPQSRLAGPAMLAAGKCYYLIEDLAQAEQCLRNSLDKYDSGGQAAHWLARTLLRSGQAAAALPVSTEALAANPDEEMLVELQFDRAEALYEIGQRRSESAEAFAAVARDFADHSRAPQAAYMAALAALGSGNYQSALKYSDQFRQRFADSNWTADLDYVTAESQLLLHNYAEATSGFRQLLKRYPHHEQRHTWLVRLALSQSLAQEWLQVISILGNSSSGITDPEMKAEAGLLLGRAYFATGQNTQAVDVLQNVVKSAPQWKQLDAVLIALARAQQATGETAAAIVTANRLLEQFDSSPLVEQALFRRGEFHASAGESPAAIADFREVVRRFPGGTLTPHALLELARASLMKQDYTAAHAAMDQLLDEHADHEVAAQGYMLRATALQNLGEYAEAIEDVQSSLHSNPEQKAVSSALHVRGLCEAALGRHADAAQTFESILATDPRYTAADQVLYELAWARSELDATAAAPLFRKLAEQFSESPLAGECWYRVGEAQYAEGDPEGAAKNFAAAVHAATTDELREKALHKLAWTYFEQGDYQNGREHFAEQLKAVPSGALAADAQTMIAECLFKQQSFKAALAAFRKALAGPPASESVRDIALLHAGQSAAQLQEWQESLDFLEQSEQGSGAAEFLDHIRYEQGWALYNLRRLEEAQALFEQVADQDRTPLGARARFMVGEALFARKEFDAAVREYFKVAYGFGDRQAPAEFHHWQAEAMFEAARCLEQTGRRQNARNLYRELIERFPESEKAPHARNQLQ